MSITTVSSLHIYPIKSTAGVNLPSSFVDELGLFFDRRFVVSDSNRQFITGRTEPKLCLIQTKLIAQGIELSAINMPTLTLLYQDFSAQYQNVTVWGDVIAGQLCSTKASTWFSEYLQRPCVLLFFGENSHRERKPNTDNARQLAFADGYPLLLISQGSLSDLNQRLLANHHSPVSMAQFRPNIVVGNCLPFAEDEWRHIRIGEVEFKVSKPCERCIFTTIDPKSGTKHLEQQPLQTLKSFRKNLDGEVLFGQNLIALNPGKIAQGDKLTVLQTQSPPALLPANSTTLVQEATTQNKEHHILNKSDTSLKKLSKKIKVHFQKWDKSHQISNVNNNTKTLLENGEDAGLILPYSCRGGMCGRCRAKLISGEVDQIVTDGLTLQEQQDGYILCCSAIAKSDVTIKHD